MTDPPKQPLPLLLFGHWVFTAGANLVLTGGQQLSPSSIPLDLLPCRSCASHYGDQALVEICHMMYKHLKHGFIMWT